MRPQPQHLVEGEPLGAAVGLGAALGQGGVGAQHPAEVRRRHRDQVAGDLPGREAPQPSCGRPASWPRPTRSSRPRAQSAAIAAKSRVPTGAAELGERLVGEDAEVGRQRLLGVLGHLLGLMCCVFPQCTTIRGIWNRKLSPLAAFSRQISAFWPLLHGRDRGRENSAGVIVVLDTVLRPGGGLPSLSNRGADSARGGAGGDSGTTMRRLRNHGEAIPEPRKAGCQGRGGP